MMKESIIAGQVKKIINKKGLKQSAVAIRAGYRPNDFSNMMCGRKQIYDFDVVKIAQALDVTPNELFGISERESA